MLEHLQPHMRYRNLDGRIEEFAFLESSTQAVDKWLETISGIMWNTPESPSITRWLIDVRQCESLPLATVKRQTRRLIHAPGLPSRELRVAYLTKTPDAFQKILATIKCITGLKTRSKWFNTSVETNRREEAIAWLLHNE